MVAYNLPLQVPSIANYMAIETTCCLINHEITIPKSLASSTHEHDNLWYFIVVQLSPEIDFEHFSFIINFF